jgi:hypothetical protein
VQNFSLFFGENLLFSEKFYNIALKNTKTPLPRRKYGWKEEQERAG